MDETVDVRTDDEIGTDHIDDGREQIEVEDFETGVRNTVGSLKAKLVAIINAIRDSMAEDAMKRE